MAKQENGSGAKPQKSALPFLSKRISEGLFILIATIAAFMLLSLISYPVTSTGWASLAQAKKVNSGGLVGAYIAYALYYLVGYLSFLIPMGATLCAWFVLKENQQFNTINKNALYIRSFGFILLLLSGCSLVNMEIPLSYPGSGGVLGLYAAKTLTSSMGIPGAMLVFLALFLVGVTLLTGLSWILAIESIGYYTLIMSSKLLQRTVLVSRAVITRINQAKKEEFKSESFQPMPPLIRAKNERKASPILNTIEEPILEHFNEEYVETTLSEQFVTPLTTTLTKPIAIVPPMEIPKPSKNKKLSAIGDLPSLNLLDKEQKNKVVASFSHQDLETISRDVEQHLLDFGLQADVVAVHPGPVITRFELQLAAGIKVSRLTSLAKDLARSLSVTSVRIVEVIPGKTVVGIELPNEQREVVRLSEVLTADVYQQAHSPITLALGVDISGHPMVVDLAKMPHLLVAGTTGSGKSVGINAMILSLLFKASPEQVRLIMVDPKMLELSVYDGIPHLLTPVVTDMKEAASALRWCVGEMEKRYRLMAALGVRNLAGFNLKVTEAMETENPLTDPLWKPVDSFSTSAPLLKTLPYIVVIIDELADMMMVVGKKVEQLIARIAQKARAAGIHLILATQRPSVDVLTGLIKSNIPTRMSFQVSSKIDSRTILDQQGAEQLLGHGDMLYLAPGTGAPLRVHGAFVDDEEVHRVADDWRARGEPEYIEEITQINEAGDSGTANEEGEEVEDSDPLYDQAVEFVLQTRKASISAVQRRLKVGYNRAARLVEEMERTGIVGPLEGGFRDILVTTPLEES